MNDRTTNQLTMIGVCLTVADKTEYKPVWFGQQPADFETELNAIRTKHAAILTDAGRAYAATTGPAHGKDLAETALEDAAFILARACAAHFKRSGDMTRHAQVDLTRSNIVRLRDEALITTATLIRDLGEAARSETGAMNRGVTQARVAALSTALTNYNALVHAPRGQVVNRSALIRDIQTRVAGLMVDLEDLDDLVLQFDGTPAGRNFIAAWKQARIIVDGGHGPGEDEEGGGTPPPGPNL